MSATREVLDEVLARELAAKVFYDELCVRVVGTEFERFLPQLTEMAAEEAGHADQVRSLIARFGR